MSKLTAEELEQFRDWAECGEDIGPEDVAALIAHIDALKREGGEGLFSVGGPTCKTCRFAAATVVNGDQAVTCRRYAPRPFNAGNWDWPAVSVSDWCGEHEPGPEEILYLDYLDMDSGAKGAA